MGNFCDKDDGIGMEYCVVNWRLWDGWNYIIPRYLSYKIMDVGFWDGWVAVACMHS